MKQDRASFYPLTQDRTSRTRRKQGLSILALPALELRDDCNHAGQDRPLLRRYTCAPWGWALLSVVTDLLTAHNLVSLPTHPVCGVPAEVLSGPAAPRKTIEDVSHIIPTALLASGRAVLRVQRVACGVQGLVEGAPPRGLRSHLWRRRRRPAGSRRGEHRWRRCRSGRRACCRRHRSRGELQEEEGYGHHPGCRPEVTRLN